MQDESLYRKYFPEIDDRKIELFQMLAEKYVYWNERINLVSRKDIEYLEVHHILHSLAIARFIEFKPESSILDVGTGGGLPGIPLAIFFPDVHFHLVDSIGKKIAVVRDIAGNLGLHNVRADKIRAEETKSEYDFVVTRAVASLDDIVRWTNPRIKSENKHLIPNGIIALKGGDLEKELQVYRKKTLIVPISDYFEESFFETKKLVFWSK